MPSVSKEIAEREIAKVKKQKRPKAYCIVRYQNRLNGDSEKGTYSGYGICYKKAHYDALTRSSAIGGIDILWMSERFAKDLQTAEVDYAWEDAMHDFD